MKKCLLLASLVVLLQINTKAQQTLFNVSVPSDTVCINQLISLTSNVTGSTYYWGFCSGFLSNTPVGQNLGNGFHLNDPSGIDIARDVDSNYYGFVINRGTSELLRLSFGRSLSNTNPTVTNYGNFNGVLPDSPSTLYLTWDAQFHNWYIFVAGGTNVSNSTLARIDFHDSLSTKLTPTIVNFGNLYNKLNNPRGLFVGYDAGQTRWYGYCVNYNTNSLIRIDFDNNITNTPLVNDIGNPNNSLSSPTDMVAQLDRGSWYFFVTNLASNSISRIDFGNTLNNLSPFGNPLTTTGDQLDSPTALTITADCGTYHLFITGNNILTPGAYNITRVDVAMDSTIVGPYYSLNIGNIGQENRPTAISHVIRDYDNLYSFVTNASDNTLTQLTFETCHNSSIHSSTAKTPPSFSYYNTNPKDTTIYNIYFAVDEGLPTQRVACQQIVVLPVPPIILFPSDTNICQRDTINLRAISADALGFKWSPLYNIADSVGTSVKAWPQYSLKYFVEIPFANGCVVDTFANIHVKQITADAGPNRQISDGAKTILGGPNTSVGSDYTYSWTPNQFLDNVASPNPTADPAYDFTYYLNVSTYLNDSVTCYANDTVVISVGCDNIHLPNAFIPGSTNSTTNHFGILNKEIVKLDYFRIFDRWGNKVFETSDPTQGWDGMENGTYAQVGVYVWEIQGYCTTGKRFTRSGNVSLLR